MIEWVAWVFLATLTPAAAEEATALPALRVQNQRDWNPAPTAPAGVSSQALELHQFSDVQRALKQTSGVYTREEDGQGLRPNIGLRGTNPDRSKKVVILEDGVLSGPAPYSAPAAYYTPQMLHTEQLEVHKGFAAVPHGPNSVGGAINYLSRDFADRDLIKADVNYGLFNSLQARVHMTRKWDWGSWLVEGGRLSSDGFKEMDGGGFTGFSQNSLISKLRWNLDKDSSSPQHLEFRVGIANEDSRETYLGLSRRDFIRNPNRRYRSSEKDKMKWLHVKAEVEHLWQVTERAALKTTVYHHNFDRTWYRLDRLSDGNVSLRSVLADPTGVNELYYDVIRGAADSSSLGAGGNLIVANNERSFFSRGIQTQFSHQASWGWAENDFQTSLRFHQDQIQRNHTFDTFEMTGGSMQSTGDPRGVDRKNRDSASALTLAIEDHLRWGDWTFSALGRLEGVEFSRRETGKNRNWQDTVAVPGIGAQYQLGPNLLVRGSVNQAATLAGLDPNQNEVKEQSTNYELGLKTRSLDNSLQTEATYFFNDYQNLIGTCTVSAGCSGGQLDSLFNGARALVQGLELQVAKSWWKGAWHFPTQLNLTLIHAQFAEGFTSANPEWGTGPIESGDPLPYVPNVLVTINSGLERGRWRQDVVFTYHGPMVDQSARAGRLTIDGYMVVDFVGRYQWMKNLSVLGRIDNVFSESYAVAARPFGFRPGKPLTVAVGLSYVF